jgi:hypothetical protein
MDPLESYLSNHCQQHPSAVMPLNAFVAAFRGQLDPDLQPAWNHGRIVAELIRRGFQVGKINSVYHVGGLAIGKWVTNAGQLVLTA